ncbi:CAP domain-containing protein [Hansschlegelia quercus]|uniref:CAP domain-containing protein n=1 Tax=Hansschlegelia quercus TaxID=2528245 RepID=A0A4Q9GIQ2_9HYPH|nr:CAP domain-containing protein [Hansschlegelia quercus]TBN53908.1 CAP domain-containing protein [Hansschlegelia quercus]
MKKPFARALGPALLAAALAGCSTSPTAPVVSTTPSLYQSQSAPGARLDKRAAAEMVSEYRRGKGLGPVTLDPTLNAMAEAQAAAMARNDKLSHEAGGTFKSRIAASGYRNGGMWENIGAGHDTLADAFTGWRSSPPHAKNMAQPKAARMGIAAVRAPGSRYEVFWAMELADPNDPRPMPGSEEAEAARTRAAANAIPLTIGAPVGVR